MKKQTTLLWSAIFALLTSTSSWAQWTNMNCNGSGAIYDMTESGGRLVVARNNSGIISTTNGTAWTDENEGVTGSFRSLKNFGGTLYAGTNGSSLFTSTDHGVTWTSLGGKSGLVSVFTTSIYKNANVVIYGTNNGSAATYYTTNNGTTWLTSDFDYGSGPQQGFEAIQYDIVELNGTLYMSTLKDFFKSTDNGANWEVVTTAPNIPDGTVTSLTTINNGLLLAIYGYGTYRSLDAGATWTQVLGGGLGTISNNMTRLYHNNGITIAGGAAGQVYISTDNAATWTDISETGIGIGEVVQSIQIFNGAIFIGTNMAVYSRSLGNLNTEDQVVSSINVYPNPTSDYCTIQFETLPQHPVYVYAMNGQLMDVWTPQNTSFQFPVHNYPSGVYVVVYQNSHYKLIKK